MAPLEPPMFRKNALPWYDTAPACIVIMVVSALVCAFAVIGIKVAWTHPAYHHAAWVPSVLSVLSAAVFFHAVFRLASQAPKREERW